MTIMARKITNRLHTNVRNKRVTSFRRNSVSDEADVEITDHCSRLNGYSTSWNHLSATGNHMWLGYYKMLLDVYSCVFYSLFFAFGYAIPLSLVCVLYGMMLHRLRNRKAPSTAASTTRSTASGKSTRTSGNGDTTARSRHSSSKRRVTRLVIVVVVIFAVSWLPAQVRYAAAESRMTDSVNWEYDTRRYRLMPNPKHSRHSFSVHAFVAWSVTVVDLTSTTRL